MTLLAPLCGSVICRQWTSRGLLPGLCMSNELIARDEGMHTSFACLLLRHLEQGAERDVVEEMMREAVELEHKFFEGEFWQSSVWKGSLTQS